MNKSIYFYIFAILFCCISYSSFSQYNPPTIDAELIITNKVTDISPESLYVRVSPISAIFNGNDSQQIGRKGFYTFDAKNKYTPVTFKKIYGDISADWIDFEGYKLIYFNHDGTDVRPQYDEYTLHAIGYGKFLVEFMKLNDEDELERISDDAYCYVDYSDGNYAYSGTPWTNDLIIFILKENGNYKIKFKFDGGDLRTLDSIPEQDRTIKIWHQLGKNNNQYRTPVKGNFYNNYPDSLKDNEYPLRAPENILVGAKQLYFPHSNPGFLNQNITINRNIFSSDTLKDSLTEIVVAKNTYFKIEPNKMFNIVTPKLPVSGFTNFIIQDSAFLYLSSNSLVNVDSLNRITLKQGGFLLFNSNSKIYIHRGAYFCNEGGIIRGNAGIIYLRGIHQILCNQLADYILQDSVKFILDSNAVLPIPNNTTLHFRGNTTSLIMNPGSKLLFGENSGIICDSGARIFAINAEFASIDSTKKWNGISLSDLSQDTIKYCTIKNAMYGITLNDKFDESDDSYSTEISNCNFINHTGYVLNNAVYIAGSNNVLIMNNNISSTSLQKGFTHGIYAEYCPEGAFNIIGNNISGAGNGITLIGCSPFAAQNILTGNEYSECGLFLDNSNGTFEYNVISDFYCSYFSYYSSPDLLKNIFENYYDDNLWLSTSSVPVMHPLINGSSIYWYAGDNQITGSPSNSGILFDEDANPLINYGYNRFEMTNNDNYIQGINPSGGGREFYVIQNYWGGTPDSNKFDVANADVIYIPYDNNSSQARATNSDSKFDIGFGLYDTVYYYEPDNPNSAQDLYLEAYQKEYSGEYSQAIDIYKEILTEYKDSSFTSSCLSRIYGCFEKKNSTQNQYSELEIYYENIQNDTAYSEIQRNIAEEFMIKTKVKQNRADEAVSDYTDIYNQNTGTPKGLHALINKEILSVGMGDNPTANSQFEIIQMKLNALNQIFEKIRNKEKNIFSQMEIKPEGYSLSQNYPNPFNPSTKIKFYIPEGGIVKIIVYDVLGKEVSVLVDSKLPAGSYETEFNARLMSGQASSATGGLASGMYFYRMVANNFSSVRKMLFIK